MSDDFLSRWSRRKEEARRADLRRGPPPEAPTAPPAVEQAPPSAHAEPGLTPEELASLPNLEELTPDTDLTGFLREGVPQALRNAALRRMWSLDPAIRDAVGHARDYAYDWNTPGGVPGSGALLPGDDVGALVRQVFGEEAAAEASPRPDAEGDGGPREEAETALPKQTEVAQAGGEIASADRANPAEGSPRERPEDTTVDEAGATGRHGSATPV